MSKDLVKWHELIQLLRIDRSGGRESRWFVPNVLREWADFHRDIWVTDHPNLSDLEKLQKIY